MTKRSRRIPAASLFLIGLRVAAGPQTEDQMSIAEIIEEEAERPPLAIRVRQASLRDYEELCALFDQSSLIQMQRLLLLLKMTCRSTATCCAKWTSWNCLFVRQIA